MAIVKTIEINASLGQSKENIQDLNEQLEIQRKVLIDLEKELLKVEEVRKQTAKTDLQAQKQLKERSEFLKTEIQNEKLGLRELNSERRAAISETQSYGEESVKSSKIIAALDKVTDGYATKIVKLYKGFGESTKAVGGFIGGLSGIQKAIVATGIGALVVGVGLLIANWDKLSKAVSGATAESKAYKEAQSEILSAVSKVQAEITKMGDTIELAKQGTISKEEALQQYNKALGESVGYAESLEQAESLLVKNAATVIEVTRLKAQSEVLYAKAAEARAKVIAGDESLKPDWWDTIKNATVAAFSGINGAAKFATEQGVTTVKNGQDAIKTAEQLEGSAADLQTKIAELQKNLEKGSLSPQQREKRNTEIKALEDKAAAEAIQREKDKAAALESIRQALIDTEDERRNEELRKIQANYDAQIALAEQYYGKESETVLALKQAQKDAYDAQQLEFYEKDAEAAIARAAEDLKLKQETANAQKAIDDATLEAKIKTLDDTENALNQLSNIAGESTVAGKGFAIASATLNTYRGVSDALAATTVTPFETALKFINAAAILTNGLRNVKKIVSVKIPNAKGGGGTGGASSPSGGAISQPPAFNVVGQGGTNQLAQVIGEQTQQPVQAYVVANDVTSAQSLQRNIQSEAGIGG
ncbi:MAG TPA: hypothetical protein VMW25_03455 [Clostridia bacterium]|nr:hypothetical protein [Clostridia bacterium]